ncbi:MAG: hypothetical protein HY781_01735 [Chloroflexi bacterium]|nr:hypothetical protein [Chloroflexota bacterium]
MPAKKKPVPPVEEEIIVPATPIEPVKPVEPVAAVVQPVPPAPVAPYVPSQSLPQTGQKPGMVQAIAIMTLINGILNIIWGLSLTGTVAIGTMFIGLLCAPVTILPSVLGIFEILYAVKLMSNPPQPVKPSQTIAILEICCILLGDVLSLVVGILALVFYNDANVKAYFARINGQE